MSSLQLTTSDFSKGDVILGKNSQNSRKRIGFYGPFTTMRRSNQIISLKSANCRNLGRDDVVLRNESSNSHQKINYSDFESSLNRMSKWLVTSLFGLNILFKHDLEALWAAMGLCINSFLSIKLKKVLNRQRPTSSSSRSDPGMASSHAQNLFYGVVFANLSFMVANNSRASHNRPSAYRCCAWIRIWIILVLFLELFFIQCMYFLYFGLNFDPIMFDLILWSLLVLHSRSLVLA